MANDPIRQVRIGTARIQLTNVQAGDDIVLDEVHLEGSALSLEILEAPGRPPAVRTGEVDVRILIT